jgi:hypothetical protein
LCLIVCGYLLASYREVLFISDDDRIKFGLRSEKFYLVDLDWVGAASSPLLHLANFIARLDHIVLFIHFYDVKVKGSFISLHKSRVSLILIIHILPVDVELSILGRVVGSPDLGHPTVIECLHIISVNPNVFCFQRFTTVQNVSSWCFPDAICSNHVSLWDTSFNKVLKNFFFTLHEFFSLSVTSGGFLFCTKDFDERKFRLCRLFIRDWWRRVEIFDAGTKIDCETFAFNASQFSFSYVPVLILSEEIHHNSFLRDG